HCLGENAKKRLTWIDRFKDEKKLKSWLDRQDWGYRVDYTSNTVQDVGIFLQYARDFQGDAEAGQALRQLLDYLVDKADPSTGLWGDGEYDLRDEKHRSRAIQAAYHFWLLWFYEREMIPYPELAVDHILKTQNKNGGFGCGVHNRKYPYNSSACEDIDSIDPLVRLLPLTDYRRDDVIQSLQRSLPWVIGHQTDSGSYVFKRGLGFEYGHPELNAKLNVGGMFPTWFRTLSLAMLGQGLPETN
ncbi:unnamed protein product, partial [marine sediment metagenome]